MNLFWSIIFIIFIIIIVVLLYYSIYCIELHRYIYCMYYPNVKYYDKQYRNLKYVDNPEKRKVVISLTTIPKRINKLKPTLCSILDQTRRVDEICINVPYTTLKGDIYNIPDWLKRLKNVRIKRCDKDWGPSTKLIPTLIREDHKTIIIVVDDDVIYGSKTVENHVQVFYQRNCKDAIISFGSKINKSLHIEGTEGFIPPPHMNFKSSGYSHVVYGHHSFLVTPEMFTKTKDGTFNNHRIFEYNRAPKECLWVDDIWFSGWLLYNNIKIWSTGFVNGTIAISSLTTSNTPSLCHNKNNNNRNNNICIKWFHQRKGVDYI